MTSWLLDWSRKVSSFVLSHKRCRRWVGFLSWSLLFLVWDIFWRRTAQWEIVRVDFWRVWVSSFGRDYWRYRGYSLGCHCLRWQGSSGLLCQRLAGSWFCSWGWWWIGIVDLSRISFCETIYNDLHVEFYVCTKNTNVYDLSSLANLITCVNTQLKLLWNQDDNLIPAFSCIF